MSCKDIAYVYYSELTQKWTFDCELHAESISFTFKEHAEKAKRAHIFLESALNGDKPLV